MSGAMSNEPWVTDLCHNTGYTIVEVLGDGNCAFRAVADQIYDDVNMHDEVRKLCVRYMRSERTHFAEFVSNWDAYIQSKAQLGVYADHLEIQALSELFNRPIEVYSMESGNKPMNIFQGERSLGNPPIRLTYHNGNHYNSLRDPKLASVGIGLVESGPGFALGQTNQEQFKAAVLESESGIIDDILVDAAIDESLVDEAMLQRSIDESLSVDEAILQRSRAEYLREQVNNVLKNQF